jgi:hypothetical protein
MSSLRRFLPFFLLGNSFAVHAYCEGANASESPDTELLPLELTAFGDIRYRITRDAADAFEVGSVEVDTALELSPYVKVTNALAYDPAADSFGLAAFTVDGSVAGPDEKHLLKCDLLQDSGLIFGKFDVPFGVAYLEYASTDNPYVLTPVAVDATHGGWNDLGTQVYLIGTNLNATLYFVNGGSFATEESTPDAAFGGRLGLLPIGQLELGGSLARVEGAAPEVFVGADLSANAGPFAFKNEYIQRRPALGPKVEGFYSEALVRHEFLFTGVRYSNVYEDERLGERHGTLTLGAEVFPQAEIRLAHLHRFDEPADTTFVQIVGGSSFQPTGLRR